MYLKLRSGSNGQYLTLSRGLHNDVVIHKPVKGGSGASLLLKHKFKGFGLPSVSGGLASSLDRIQIRQPRSGGNIKFII
jgi:hypothetical protein